MRERLPMRRWWLYGLAILAVQILLRLVFVRDGYFWQDDFRYLYDVRDGLSLDVAFQDYNGHLMPGSFLLSWVLGVLGPSWGVAVAMLLVLQVAAGLSLLWVSALVFRGHPGSLLVYAMAVFTPLTLVGSTWFAYGLQLWPQQIALCLALGCFVNYRRTESAAWILGVLTALVLGLLFWEKGVLVLPVLLLFSVLIVDRGTAWPHRLRTVLAQWRLWVPMIVVVSGYTVLYLRITSSAAGRHDGGTDVVEFFDNAVMRTLLPGLLGGPWTDSGAAFTISAMPNDVVTAVVALVWLALVGGSFLFRGKAAGAAWLWALFAILANYALLLLFRPEASTLVRDSRYIADVVPLLAVAVGLAFAPMRTPGDPAELRDDGEGAGAGTGASARGESGVDRPFAAAGATALDDPAPAVGRTFDVPLRVTLAVATFAAACLFASGWITTKALMPQMRHVWSKAFVNGVSLSAAADPERPLLNRRSPSPNVFFGTQAVLAKAMGIPANYVEGGRDLTMFDDTGRSGPVSVPFPEYRKDGPTPGCGWLLRPGRPARIDLGNRAGSPDTVITLGVLSSGDHPLRVRLDGERQLLTSTGPEGLSVLTLRLTKPAGAMTVSVTEPGASACVANVAVGAPGVDSGRP